MSRWTRLRGRLRRHGWAHDEAADEGGFILLESIISISLLTIIMAGLATFFITASAATSSERERQLAVQLDDTTMDQLRSVHAGDLPLGRSPTLANAQFSAASSTVAPWLTTMSAATDTSTTALTVPMSSATTLSGTVFTTTTYLGWCYLPTATASGTDCTNTAAAASSGIRYLRAVVAVSWTGAGCPGTCWNVDASLFSTTDDPAFSLNQAAPAAPIVSNPGHQDSAINDTVSLQLSTSASTGVAPFTWTVSGLPAGLTMTTTGLISGTPTTQVTNRSVTVTVTDAFLRTASATFTWTILPDLVPASPGNQTSYVNVAITPTTFSASGGSGGPFTWTDPGNTLPPGLALSSTGTVTGTPTTRGTYPVQFTVKDASGRTRTLTFTWNVTYAPLTATQADQTSRRGVSIGTLTLSASGGSGTYVWTDPTNSLPPGLSLSSGGVVTGTPTTIGTYSVSIRVTDPVASMTTNDTFTWTVVSASPSISGVTAIRTSVGATIADQSLTYSCPSGDCTYTVTSAPSGIGVDADQTGSPATSLRITGSTSGTIYLRGTIAATTATGSATVTVKLTDNGTSSTASSTATWTLVGPMSISRPGPLLTLSGATPSQAVSYTCLTSRCTITLTNAPSGVGLSTTSGSTSSSNPSTLQVNAGSGTIYVAGRIASGSAGSYPVTVTITDPAGSYISASATWTVLL